MLEKVEWKTLGEVCKTITSPVKLKSSEYQEYGEVPIIDQGIRYIAGYTNTNIHALPVWEYIIFWDHSECIKYVNFSFIQGADGLKILIPKGVLAKYIYYVFIQFYKKQGAYKRHWTVAKETLVPIPSLATQQRIVTLLDKFDALVNDLTTGLPAELESRKKQYEHYRNQLLTFTPLKE